VTFQFLTAASMKMTALWEIALCGLVEVDRRFRGAYCFIVMMMEAVPTYETSIYFYETALRYVADGYHSRNCIFIRLCFYIYIYILYQI
jgi:hypothetical protein